MNDSIQDGGSRLAAKHLSLAAAAQATARFTSDRDVTAIGAVL